MIKGISFLRSAGSAAVYDRLSSFFAALGFAPGPGWNEASSRGAAFLAPLGNLEIVDGEFPSTADVLVEVTALDAVHQAARNWLATEVGDEAVARLSPLRRRTGSRAYLLLSRSLDSNSAFGRGATR
jgi:6,7-dimethyl-8-ribityllumazine synthase